jgi:hypothetical protein
VLLLLLLLLLLLRRLRRLLLLRLAAAAAAAAAAQAGCGCCCCCCCAGCSTLFNREGMVSYRNDRDGRVNDLESVNTARQRACWQQPQPPKGLVGAVTG